MIGFKFTGEELNGQLIKKLIKEDDGKLFV